MLDYEAINEIWGYCVNCEIHICICLCVYVWWLCAYVIIRSFKYFICVLEKITIDQYSVIVVTVFNTIIIFSICLFFDFKLVGDAALNKKRK